jgi:phospholipid/cholesterol/gamma-HCH transport system substrate-binding protein
MIFGKSKLELKVGIFVFIGLVILVIFILLIGEFKTWSSRYRLNFVFNFANGVKIGAPVRYAGVDVGEVSGIKLVFVPQEQRSKVQITCWVKNDVVIPDDSTVWVNTLGLLGEKYIEVMPGKDYTRCLKEGGILVGTDPIPMQEVGQLAKNIGDALEATLLKIKNGEGTVGKLISSDEIYKQLEALVTDIRKNPWKLFIKTKEKK